MWSFFDSLFPTLLLLGVTFKRAISSTPGPLSTSSRWIIDSSGGRVKLRCINWGGHMEASIPEGLQHQSISFLADWISSNKFNCVRLTWSVDMALNPDQTVEDSFNALPELTGANEEDVKNMYNQMVEKNSFLENETSLGTFGNVIDALNDKGVMVILDNHVSRKSWCCNYTDGNGWWAQAAGYNDANSRFFDADDWVKAHSTMANFAKDHSNVVGIGIRNELRPVPGIQGQNDDWYTYITKGAQAIHDANPDLLIAIGGTESSTNAEFLRNNPLDNSGWKGKTLWEFHAYSWSPTMITGNCDVSKTSLGAGTGFLLEQDKPYTGPLWLSEFGVGQDLGSDSDRNYLNCLVGYMEGNDADWAVWAIQGSYYVRDGKVDYDESFGLLSSDWSDWRNKEFSGLLGKMWDQTQNP